MTEIIKNIFSPKETSKQNIDFDNIKFYTYVILAVFFIVVLIGSLSGSGEGLKIFEYNLRPIASEAANAIYVLAGGIINHYLNEISVINRKLYGTKKESQHGNEK